MKFEKLFKSLSFAVVFCGFLSIWVSGTFGIGGSALFLAVLAAGWFLEGTRWQISERFGTVLIVGALPAFYIASRMGVFQFPDSGALVAGVLGRLILTLSGIKILQRKSDRDWIFLYLMAFFEVLLAAGLSISALYLFSFVLYVFVMVCTIIVFEIRKSGESVAKAISAGIQARSEFGVTDLPKHRLPLTAAGLISFIILLAIPTFFLLPRVGGAGFGSGQGKVSTSSGFSDSVRLGGFGTIEQNDQVVMRVRIEGGDGTRAALKWRGVALDTFDNKSWSRSKGRIKEPRVRSDRDLIQLDYASGRESLTTQVVYLEPLDAPVLFGLPRMVGVQGNFPVLYKDRYGSVMFDRSTERISYKVFSDRSLPPVAELRSRDRAPVPDDLEGYLQLPPDLDGRVEGLAATVTRSSRNRYDKAEAVESYLQNNFGYTLEQKASGDQPMADFLFNVREGHCEYFATAMAIMLRTQGIPTRVVNGFSQGEYNETADVWVVRQRNAHSWVEVFFPGENVWVPFDPTPFAAQSPGGSTAGLGATFNKYLEALETFWIQYFVAFDNQEQRSLFTSFRRGFSDYQTKTSSWMNRTTDRLAEWWSQVRGDGGLETSVYAVARGGALLIGAATGLFLVWWLYRKLVKLKVWRKLWDSVFATGHASIVEFYDRMISTLEEKGMKREPHQTPLEFAFATGMPEALRLTEKYNGVRFGEKQLSQRESEEIEDWLELLKGPAGSDQASRSDTIAGTNDDG